MKYCENGGGPESSFRRSRLAARVVLGSRVTLLTRVMQLALIAIVASGPAPAVTADEAATKPDETAQVFGLTKVWTVHVKLSAESWRKMQPRGNGPNFGFPPPGGGPGPKPAKPGDVPGKPPFGPAGAAPPADGKPTEKPAPEKPVPSKPDGAAPAGKPLEKPAGKPVGPPGAPPPPGAPAAPFRPGSFGFEFDYVRGDVQFGDETFRDVGLRFKGNGTYMVSQSGPKRPIKIDFDRYVPGQRFHGLQQINLQNNSMDPTNVRQALSFPVFEAAGIPAPRTALAEVFLTVEGEFNRELIGVYTIVEEVDRSFLRRRFGSDRGMLLKPEGTQGFEHRGDDWSAYAWFEPKWKPTPAQAQRLIDATRLVAKADDATFRREIGDYLDVDEFLRFLAANTLMANMDSFLTHVHNYYVYLVPETNKFVFLPWDVDLSMGSFLMVGSAEQLQQLSVAHPHMGESKLIERLLKIDEFDRAYRDHLKKLTERCFGAEGITLRDLPKVRATVAEAAAREEAAAAKRPAPPGPFGGGRGGPFGSLPPLEKFIQARVTSIEAQLGGKSEGYVPKMAFGPPGGGGPPPGPGAFLAAPLIKALDANQDGKLTRNEVRDGAKAFFAKSDRQSTGTLTDDTFCEGMARILPPPPGFPAGPADPPPGGGPARFLALPVFEKADTDKDKKLTLDAWLQATDELFTKSDADKSDTLDDKEVGKAFEIVFAPRN